MSLLRQAGLRVRAVARVNFVNLLAVFFLLNIVALSRPAQAMDIKTVKSASGIEAWLVEEHSVPLVALRFAFTGGSSQDPADKAGVSNFLSAMLDEGAGDLKSAEFQERMEDIAMRMSYEDSRDTFYGSVETLSANRPQAMELLKLALTKPRFDDDAIERIRGQLKASIVYASRDPDRVAGNAWYAAAFPNHPYGKPKDGTLETISSITRDDLEAYRSRIFARENLKVVAVGDIDADALAKLLDEVFGDLPQKAKLNSVSDVAPPKKGSLTVTEMDVPQSVAVFGLGGLKRKDPDFMSAFVLNHIIGGGGFASKLMEEVREKRGLAYSVYSYLSPMDHSAIFLGSVATKNEAIAESLDVIRAELKKMVETGPTEEDLKNAKDYLTGSYALRFDSNAKIASQLLGIMVEGMGIDYVNTRNAQIEAVTLEDIKQAAKRFLDLNDLIVTVVGKPAGLAPRG
ncbi:pitrilysin family protein [Filomicrobium sp.]|uniref:M16 family metallopeptidase n=1 Tax=Filomicrobium sp. TaxID=2024831 RepID=UPI00258B29EE|nr:pitrilysin family protein [Filomicrobium sp.]MCV0368766.1 insulinase family protein [Filomicrobium sp.]